jgi:2-C-methyl-D-erythritol 4-phosphate cytidylyltransferase
MDSFMVVAATELQKTNTDTQKKFISLYMQAIFEHSFWEVFHLALNIHQLF